MEYFYRGFEVIQIRKLFLHLKCLWCFNKWHITFDQRLRFQLTFTARAYTLFFFFSVFCSFEPKLDISQYKEYIKETIIHTQKAALTACCCYQFANGFVIAAVYNSTWDIKHVNELQGADVEAGHVIYRREASPLLPFILRRRERTKRQLFKTEGILMNKGLQVEDRPSCLLCPFSCQKRASLKTRRYTVYLEKQERQM